MSAVPTISATVRNILCFLRRAICSCYALQNRKLHALVLGENILHFEG